MPGYRFLMEYDGGSFAGWQYQPGCRTVQGEVERALEVYTKESIRVTAAGRTDAGVHAEGQVVSFNLAGDHDPWRMAGAMNGILDKDVRVLSCALSEPGFDARRSAAGKTYRYLVINRTAAPALLHGRVLHHPHRLDVGLMMDAAACFEGEHDFSAYRAAGCESAHARRRVLSCRVFSGEDGVLVIEVTATAFVKNMVRIMAGTLLEIGGGRLPSGTVQEALASGSRNAAGPTAPPHGLYLHKVYYGKIPDIGLVWPVFVQAG